MQVLGGWNFQDPKHPSAFSTAIMEQFGPAIREDAFIIAEHMRRLPASQGPLKYSLWFTAAVFVSL